VFGPFADSACSQPKPTPALSTSTRTTCSTICPPWRPCRTAALHLHAARPYFPASSRAADQAPPLAFPAPSAPLTLILALLCALAMAAMAELGPDASPLLNPSFVQADRATTFPSPRRPSRASSLAPTVAGVPRPPCLCRRRRLLPWPHHHGPRRAELGSPMGARGPPRASPPLSHGRRRPQPPNPRALLPPLL
jgi:hypothetical protein